MPVNDTEPRYQLVDSGGNVVGTLYFENGSVRLQEGTNQNEVDLASDGTFNSPVIDTDSLSGADIANANSGEVMESNGDGTLSFAGGTQTLVSSRLSTDQSITAGVEATLQLDVENEDLLSEYDTGTYTFTPSETGWYTVWASAAFQLTADDDDVVIVFRNTTTATDLLTNRTNTNTADRDVDILTSGLVNLTAGNDYQVIVANRDSNDTIEANDQTTYLMIQRSESGSGN